MEFHSGAVIETHETPAYQSLGAARSVQLVYDSLRADPRPIVHIAYADVDPATYSVPDALRLIAKLSVQRGNFRYQLPGHAGGELNLTGGEHFWRLPAGRGPVDAGLQVDLRDQPSGRYDYVLQAGVRGFAGSRGYIGTSSDVPGDLIHVNLINSPFGHGWSIAGLVSLVENPDGSVLWIDGDGSEMLFEPPAAAGQPYRSPPGDFSVLEKTGGNFRLTMKDLSVYDFDAQLRLATVRDRVGNVTRYEYGPGGLLAKIVDPVGLETTFSSSQGRITSITDPTGRVTSLSYDDAGNLTRITDPDGTSRQFTYDGGRHMTGEIDKRGNSEQTIYDFAGRAVEGIRRDGSVIRVSPAETVGLFPVDRTIDPESAPVASRVTAAEAKYADGRGNVTSYILDSSGQLVSARDAFGPLPGMLRNEANVVTSATNARGNTTGLRYDAKGNITSVVDEVSAAGVLAMYTFEGNADDVTGSGHHGTVVGATLGAGFEGAGFQFDGVDDFVELSLNINPSLHPKLTMGAWVKANNANPIRQVVSHADGCFDRSIGIDFRGEGAGWSAFTGTGEVLGSKPVAVGEWTFLAAVYDQDAGQVTFYVDDQSLTEAGTLEEGFNFVRLGANPAFGEFFAGSIDNVFFIADALTPAKIAAIRQGGAGAVLAASEGGKQLAYDPVFSRMTNMVDEQGRETQFDIDPANGNVLRETRIVGTQGGGDDAVTQFTYTSQGLVDTITDPLGVVIDFDYDSRGRLVTVTEAKGTADESVRRMEYDAAGNLTARIDERGFRTEYQYDSLNRLTEIKEPDPDGAGPLTASIERFDYDANGNVIESTNARGHVQTWVYDSVDRPITVTDPLNGVARLRYDAVGNIIGVVDELGRESTFRYDTRNRLVDTINAAGGRQTSSYDADDNLTAITDENGRTTRFRFDSRGRLTELIDPLGHLTRYTYDLTDQLIAVTDRNGNRTQFAYDALGRQIAATDPLGSVLQWEYDPAGNLIASVDELGRRTTHDYDQRHRLVTVTNAKNDAVQFEYDEAGNLAAIIDERGHRTQYQFDGLNRTVQITDPLGGTKTFLFDANDNLIETTDELGRKTVLEYDALDRRTRITNPLGHSEQLAYDAVGNVTQLTDELGRVVQIGYDALNRRTRIEDPLGGFRTFTYDPAGNLTAATDELGRRTQLEYDPLNRHTRTVNPLGEAVRLTYDAEGNVLSVTDPLGQVTRTIYDGLHRPTQVTDARGAVTRYEYDAIGNVTRLVDPVGNATAYTYDQLNRLLSETNSLGASRQYVYDAAGNVTRQMDRNGRVRDFVYDALNRAVSETWLASNTPVRTIGFAFDSASQLISANDPDSHYEYTYDADGRLTNVTNSGTAGVPQVTFQYTYDAADNRLTRGDTVSGAASGTTAYAWDALNRLTRMTQSGPTVTNKRVDFSYDAAGQPTSISRFTDLGGAQLVAASTSSYDAAGRLTNLAHKQGERIFAGYSWTYDRGGRVTVENSSDGTATFSYDAVDQLLGTDFSFQSDETFAYDLNGNRTSGGHQVGPNNRLAADATFDYAYDAEGNRTRRTDRATGEITEYDWDHRNRLVRVTTKSAGGIITAESRYDYDVFDRRIAKSVDADGAGANPPVVDRFVYDGDRIALEFDGAGTRTHRYLHGPDIDQILADERATGEVLWPLADHLGTIRDVIDSTGERQNHLVYDSFGELQSESSPDMHVRFGFTGREYDVETRLLYSRFRYYSPETGRWLSEDPIGFAAGDRNLTRYVGNAPTNWTDPFGLQAGSMALDDQTLANLQTYFGPGGAGSTARPQGGPANSSCGRPISTINCHPPDRFGPPAAQPYDPVAAAEFRAGLWDAVTFGLFPSNVERSGSYYAGLGTGIAGSTLLTGGLAAAGRIGIMAGGARLYQGFGLGVALGRGGMSAGRLGSIGITSFFGMDDWANWLTDRLGEPTWWDVANMLLGFTVVMRPCLQQWNRGSELDPLISRLPRGRQPLFEAGQRAVTDGAWARIPERLKNIDHLSKMSQVKRIAERGEWLNRNLTPWERIGGWWNGFFIFTGVPDMLNTLGRIPMLSGNSWFRWPGALSSGPVPAARILPTVMPTVERVITHGGGGTSTALELQRPRRR